MATPFRSRLAVIGVLVLVWGSCRVGAEEYDSRSLANLISCYGVTPTSDGRLLFTTSDNGIIGVFDAVEERYQEAIDLREIVVWPTGGVVAKGKLYTESFTDIVVIDIETLEVITLLPQQHFLGPHFGDLVASSNGERVYGIVGSTSHLTVVDTEIDSIVGEVEVGGNFTGIGISPGDDRIYLSNREEGRFVVVDAVNLEVLVETTFLPEDAGFLEFPTEICVDSINGSVYVSYVGNDFGGRIAKINREGELLDTFTASSYSTGVDVTGDGEFLVLGNGEILSTQFGESVIRFQLPVGLSSVSMSADGSRGYITNINSQYLYTVDGFTPLLWADGSPELGGEIVLHLRVPNDATRMYQLLASTGVSEGINLPDGRIFPLDDDHLVRRTRDLPEEGDPVFHGFLDYLSDQGEATAVISVTQELLDLVGPERVFHVAYASMWNPPPSKSQVKTISNVLTFVVEGGEGGEGEGGGEEE